MYLQGSVQSVIGPIKLVDMDKLLQRPPRVGEKQFQSEVTCKVQECDGQEKSAAMPRQLLQKQKNANVRNQNKKNKFIGNNSFSTKLLFPEVSSRVTVFHVLDCLKVILPGKFDLSRLIPNEKVAALVIRFLKLDENIVSQNAVKRNLKILIEAAKLKGKTYGDDLTHPYLHIKEKDLQSALTKVLPVYFSLEDLSNEILNCICIILKQEIYTDGYDILHSKIQKLMNKGQNYNAFITQPTDLNTSSNENSIFHEQEKLGNNKLSSKYSPANRINSKTQPYDTKTSSGTILHHGKSNKFQRNIIYTEEKLNKSKSNVSAKILLHDDDVDDPNYCFPTNSKSLIKNKNAAKRRNKKSQDDDKDWCDDTVRPKSVVKKFENMVKLGAVLNYLEEKKCSAKDVLVNFRLMFYLCRFLHVKSRKSNLQRVKTALNFIIERNINKNNVEQVEDELYQNKKPAPKKFVNRSKTCVIKDDHKLNLRPVVVLHNLTDYRKEDMLFMTEKRNHNSNEDCNDRVPFYFQQKSTLQKYSSDYVREVTNKCYKEFRRIIMKKDGNKVIFRLKYARLPPGTTVFVKYYISPSMGWVKGSIVKVKSSLRYLVQVDGGEIIRCVAEQLRPFPGRALQQV